MKDALREIKYRQLTMWDYPQFYLAEQGTIEGVYDSRKTSENNRASTEKELMEWIVSLENLKLAVKKVKGNRGAPGIDGMEVEEIDSYFKANTETLRQSILQGRYKPQPVKRVEIPKEQKGKTRKLGIPTVIDRVVQQAITQVLSHIYEPQFQEYSYGFRPGKNAHQAVTKSVEYMNSGYIYVVDMDLEKFFDTVNQSKMAQLLSKTIKDGRVISLIHKFMRAGVVTKSSYEETVEGVAQGGPLSPLLSNILLNELDKELGKRGHRYVRYADDCMILCRSLKGAQRTKENIIPFIEGKLFLKVNKEKTKVAECTEIKYLGFGFYRKKDEIRIQVHEKSKGKMKERIRALTQRNHSISHEERARKINAYIKGWVNYYALADMKAQARKTDGWMRRRIRTILWKQWKRPKTRKRKLLEAGLERRAAGRTANTRKGLWRIARSPALHRALGNEYINRLGYLTFSEQLLKICGTGGTAVCGTACAVV